MIKILIDIGHGGTDPGAKANGLVEKDLNLKVGLLVRDYLSGFECEIRLTREMDKSLSPADRIAIAKAFNPTLCVSVHHNATDDIKARGAEVIHAHYDQFDDKLALDILQRLTASGMPARRAFTKLNDRGTDWYYMIRRIWDNDTEAIITEGGFLTNEADAALLKTEDFLRAEAHAIAYSIVDYLKLQPKQPTEEQKLNTAISKLKYADLINTAEYWTENAKAGKTVKGEYAAQLILNMARYIG